MHSRTQIRVIFVSTYVENRLAAYGRMSLKVSFFPRLIKYFYSPRTVSSELKTTQMCPTERERPQTDQLPRKYLLSFFLLTFILKIQRSTIKTGSAVACISAQAGITLAQNFRATSRLRPGDLERCFNKQGDTRLHAAAVLTP